MMKEEFLKLPKKGFVKISPEDLSELVMSCKLIAGKIVTVEIPIEKYIVLNIKFGLTIDGKRLKVEDKMYLVQIGEMSSPYSELAAAKAAVKPILDGHYSRIYGGS